MNIFQIVEQTKIIRTNTDLGTAFSKDEWIRILNYFVSLRNGSLGSNRSLIDTKMNTFHEYLGVDMEPGSVMAGNWNARAARYNMDIDAYNVTWQKIYNHLAPYTKEDLPDEYDNVSAIDVDAVTFSLNIRELYSLGEHGDGPWTESKRDEFTAYVRQFHARLIDKKLSDGAKEWYNASGTSNHLDKLYQAGLDKRLAEPDGINKDEFMGWSYSFYNSINSAYETWKDLQ
jgi:hypothetical protein